MDPKLIDEYDQGASTLSDGIVGLSRSQLLATPVPGTWSIQQIVLHVADADLAFADRMKRIIAEENPTLLAWSENKWTASLAYNDQSAEEAAQLFRLLRRNMARVLRTLPAEAFDRSGTHSERGPQILAVVLGFSVNHLNHHLKFLNHKRELVLKPESAAKI